MYKIMQGIISESGTGDYHLETECKTKKEAIKEFNRIKKNTKGYALYKGYYLETMLLKDDDMENIIELYRC